MSQAEVSQASQLLVLLHDNQREDDRWFVRRDIDEMTGRLRRLFWMNPQQKELYIRYHDVVLSDCTAQTNRFNMPLNNLVIIDSNAKSRLVGCALLSGETAEDYEWVLKQLLEASNNLAPGVIIIDEDPAMEVACASVVPHTTIINCIWHLGTLNLPKNLRGALRGDWERFILSFWEARNSLTPEEFDCKWLAITEEFRTYGRKVESYLNRLHDRRIHRAWPWVRTQFTAGVQSTQRVEKVHNIIKSSVTKVTPLKELFKAIEAKVSDERSNAAYFRYKEKMKTNGSQSTFAAKVFAGVEEVNKRYLADYALYQMRNEMTQSIFYQSKDHTPIRERTVVAENIEELDEQEKISPVCKPKIVAIDNVANLDLFQIESSKKERCKASLAALTSSIDSDKVLKVFDVAFTLALDSPQHVIILQDGSFLCTCLLLQNSGIVCRHFFHLMKENKVCKYHISLIRKRWFKEDLQDNPDINLMTEPFVFSETQKDEIGNTESREVPKSYMEDILRLFPKLPIASRSDQLLLSKKRRFGVLSGMSKELADKASVSHEGFERIRSILAGEMAALRNEEEVKDPTYVTGKGRPRKSRLTSAAEPRKGRQRSRFRCRKCGEDGHNSRTCGKI